MAVQYRLVFRGKFLPGMSHGEVVANLVALFRVPMEQIEAMLANPPAVLKNGIDVEQGNRYLEALLNAGLITHLEATTDAEGNTLPEGWDGIERRRNDRSRRTGVDRRGGNRDASMRPDRRQNRGRRKTDH
jgi:hypothetical protein